MSPVTKPCPACRAPILLVEGVKEGICPSCRRGYKSLAGMLQKDGELRWPNCSGAASIGDSYMRGGRAYIVFAAVDWHDPQYNCGSTELYLMASDGDEISLESERDDYGAKVWWLEYDVSAKVKDEGDALVYNGQRYQSHGPAMSYGARASVGCFDSRYTVNEVKRTQWFKPFTGDLDQRLPRIGKTEELGRMTYFMMEPAPSPPLRTSYALASGVRKAQASDTLLPVIASVLAVTILLALHFLFSVTALNQRVYSMSGSSERHWISDPLTLPGHTSNVRADLSTTLQDGWLDAVLCLVSSNDSQRYCTVAHAARWRDGDGDTSGQAWFSAVPPGVYVLEAQIDYEQSGQAVPTHGITLVRDTVRSDYLWWSLLLLGGLPIVALVVRSMIDQGKTNDLISAVLIILMLALMWWLDT